MVKIVPLRNVTQSQTIRVVKMDPPNHFNCIQGVSCCAQGGSTPLTPQTNTAPAFNGFNGSFPREHKLGVVSSVHR